MMGAIKFIAMYLVGMLLGAIGVIGIVVLLMVSVDHAVAHEPHTTAVRPATLGEQNRSLNYQSGYHTVENGVVYVEAEWVPLSTGCEKLNRDLYVKVELIAHHIALRPEKGYIFKDALLTIHSLWCTQ